MTFGGWTDWPESDGAGMSEIWTSPVSICPDHYGATPNINNNERYWYAGSGGETCNWLLFPSVHILPSTGHQGIKYEFKSISIIIILIVITSACSLKARQELPYEIVNDGIAFPTEVDDRDKILQLIVISELTQISQLEFSEALLSQVSEIDFQQSLIILFPRGQLPESGTVEKIVRDNNEIVIRTTDIVPGPGSYALSGFTPSLSNY